ncbi:gephyrin-like molybdotransferase Glp [Pedobacter sp. AW1-32]|uniref:molybdopterin molybdotransferase MoeA n=1 Tax=Pedobacter sp. AW1-32 TaxID=3383026 RepID=UPI003FED87BA
MIGVEEAKKLVLKHSTELNPTVLKLQNAANHILAADIFAQYDIPAFRQSSMDGYAIKFARQSNTFKIIGEMAAGTSTSLTISHGECTRIFTGAPLPDGADTVVMQEKTVKNGNQLIIKDEHLQFGANVRAVGAEIQAANLALKKGSLLTPAALGFLAGIGVTDVNVFPMPKVAIILTGNELQQPGFELQFGQVYESNSYSLSAALKKEGISDLSILQADDNLNILTEVLESALEHSDVVLLTGGVSVGDYDFVIEAAKHCGIEQIFHKVKQKPGKPLFFGTKQGQLIFGLPGNPSSVLNCYYNYVLPAIKKRSAKSNSTSTVHAKLTHAYEKNKNITHFLKGNYQNGKATPLAAQESFKLNSFAEANCLIRLDEQQEVFAAGDNVEVLLLPV